ncbi:MAG: response regulator, partial [Anaerolineales bacterium]|nr:response regulator [Anaerolineales bacterium]
MSKPLYVLLIVETQGDSDPLVRQLLHGGYEPHTICVNTAESLQAALARRPWDIVLASYVLPQFSALAALEILQQMELDIPFIIIAEAINEQVAVTAMRAGAHDYVMKDNLARLVPAVTRELQEHHVRQEQQQRQRHLDLLNQITRTAATILDEKVMFNAQVTAVRELMEADGVGLTLWQERQALPLVVASQFANATLADGFPQPKPGETNLTESALQAGVPLVINDVTQTPFLGRRLVQQLRFRSMLVMP